MSTYDGYDDEPRRYRHVSWHTCRKMVKHC